MADSFATKGTRTTEPELVEVLLPPDIPPPPPPLIALDVSKCTLPVCDALQELDSLRTGAGTEREEMG